jgi:hypothetical protein
MVAEGEVAELLARFNNSYVMDVIDNFISNRYAYNPTLSNPNIVNSYEINFKDMLVNYPSDAESIMSIRNEVYLTIINKICSAFNVQYLGDEPDCYIIAYNLYDLFVSGYARNIINFFANYIYYNRNTLYSNMGLDRYKKVKDSSSNYIRKVYDDTVVAIIIARIKEVIYYISGFDIDFYTFLSMNYNRDMCDFLYQNIQPFGNIFKDEFCQVVNNPTILTEIRIAIQKLLESDIISQQEQVPEQQETNDEEYNEDEEGAE